MHAAIDSLAFTPPQPRGLLRAMGLALLAHGVLVLVLSLGLQWRANPVPVNAEAELWASVPEAAAPQGVEVEPQPEVTPPPAVQALTETPTLDADVAIQQAKKRADAESLALEKKRAQEQQAQKQQELAKKKAETDAKAKAAQANVQKEKLEAQKLEIQRQANLTRMAGLAGATGGLNATGTTRQSAGPSAGYAGRLQARIKPNIVFTDEIVGNPRVEIEVRAAPDGTILSRKVVVSGSGVKAWDEAVLKAIDKTQVLPRDVDGSVPSSLIIGFRPKD